MTIHTPDDRRETTSFKIADHKIENLLNRLADKRVCPYCTARALAYHAAFVAEQTMGSAEAVAMLEDMVDVMRKRDVPPSAPLPSTEAH
jgi:hypothetical protein